MAAFNLTGQGMQGHTALRLCSLLRAVSMSNGSWTFYEAIKDCHLKSDRATGILDLMSTSSAYNREESIEGMVAFAIPIKANSRDLQAAIWAVELTSQVPN